jgi:hypothetical protein
MKTPATILLLSTIVTPCLADDASPVSTAQLPSIHSDSAKDSVRAAHAGLTQSTQAPNIHVDKANDPDARTVAEVNEKVAELKDQPVVVRGQVVKYNPGIMGKNWIHLRDGTGSAAERSNDLLVTSLEQAKVGDVVTARGIVRMDKDFGYGYRYQVLVEEATLAK